jgi:signal transduction histidine kinase
MCKWTAFAIDSEKVVCEDSPREKFFLLHSERLKPPMPGIITPTTVGDPRQALELPIGLVKTLLEAARTAVWIADRSGRVLVSNENAREFLGPQSVVEFGQLNVFRDLLKTEPNHVGQKIDAGEYEVEMQVQREDRKTRARIQWASEPGCLIVQIETEASVEPSPDAATQLTVQELLQEREITYRNLLAAYLKLQEVNRQKTVFLASAAHELKTPLAVIKGYYDLMLTGSLGRLTDKQRDILEESKDSCERLVRLVSMFLNYSALESGKLVLQLRENDLRDCLDELAKRWSEAFQRKGVKLEASFDPSIPTFRFDYQKVQQAAANLLDNSLKHTPAGGTVTLKAGPHFWERRVAAVAPVEERRRFRLPRPNSVEVSVADSGPGIAAEHHQEIFEDFVRVDRNTSGMGLGLAIAKRLIQAHRGKIWVESEPKTGSRFTFLLPMDQG